MNPWSHASITVWPLFGLKMRARRFFTPQPLFSFPLRKNAVFVCGYFKTAYKFGKPFVCFTIVAFLVASVGEALHFVPGLEAINAFGFEHIGLQLGVLAAGAALYALLTLLSMKRAIRHFELIDL